MKKLVIILSFPVLGICTSAQQLNNGSSADYKHPQLANKSAVIESEHKKEEELKDEFIIENTHNYKDQRNNLLLIKGTRRRNHDNSPNNTDKTLNKNDYKHPNEL